MTMLYSKPKRLSAWQRYAIFVGCMALVYGMGVMALRAAIMPVLQESPGRINSKAPSLQFGIGGPKQSTRHMQSPARHKPWVEIVSGASADEPRIFIVHNLLSDAECDHLISLALKKGLKSSLITPYGSHDLVESTTRTNKQAWLEYGEDDIVKGIEERIAKLTKTYPEQGENLQVQLHMPIDLAAPVNFLPRTGARTCSTCGCERLPRRKCPPTCFSCVSTPRAESQNALIAITRYARSETVLAHMGPCVVNPT